MQMPKETIDLHEHSHICFTYLFLRRTDSDKAQNGVEIIALKLQSMRLIHVQLHTSNKDNLAVHFTENVDDFVRQCCFHKCGLHSFNLFTFHIAHLEISQFWKIDVEIIIFEVIQPILTVRQQPFENVALAHAGQLQLGCRVFLDVSSPQR